MESLAIIGDLGLNVLDEKEIARCKQLFEFYDEDKDGKLTYAEMLTCVRCCGRNPSVDEFKELVTIIDTRLVRPPPPRRIRPHPRGSHASAQVLARGAPPVVLFCGQAPGCLRCRRTARSTLRTS